MPPKRLSAELAFRMILGEVSDSSDSESETTDEEKENDDHEKDHDQEKENDDFILPHPRGDEVSDDDEAAVLGADLLIDKDGQRWSMDPPDFRGRRDAANVFRQRTGPKPSANQDSVLQTWQLFFTNQLLTKILHFSQQKAVELGLNITLSLVQLKAFLGILYFRGMNNDNKVPIDELWSDESNAFYRATMSSSLFKTWLRVIRFDSATGRRERARKDSFTAFRDIWTEFNSSLRKHFELISLLTSNIGNQQMSIIP